MIDESHRGPDADDTVQRSDLSDAEPGPSPSEFEAAAWRDRCPLLARPLVKFTVILLAAALMLVLLGLLVSPRYWRF